MLEYKQAKSSLCLITHDDMKAYSRGGHLQLLERHPIKRLRPESSDNKTQQSFPSSRGAYRIVTGKPEGKRPLGRPRRRWEDNIKMDIQEV
jgi:hypothetical protein